MECCVFVVVCTASDAFVEQHSSCHRRCSVAAKLYQPNTRRLPVRTVFLFPFSSSNLFFFLVLDLAICYAVHPPSPIKRDLDLRTPPAPFFPHLSHWLFRQHCIANLDCGGIVFQTPAEPEEMYGCKGKKKTDGCCYPAPILPDYKVTKQGDANTLVRSS